MLWQGAQRAVGGDGDAKPGNIRMEQRKGFSETKARGNCVGKWG